MNTTSSFSGWDTLYPMSPCFVVELFESAALYLEVNFTRLIKDDLCPSAEPKCHFDVCVC